jgi:hypothetical protein
VLARDGSSLSIGATWSVRPVIGAQFWFAAHHRRITPVNDHDWPVADNPAANVCQYYPGDLVESCLCVLCSACWSALSSGIVGRRRAASPQLGNCSSCNLSSVWRLPPRCYTSLSPGPCCWCPAQSSSVCSSPDDLRDDAGDVSSGPQQSGPSESDPMASPSLSAFRGAHSNDRFWCTTGAALTSEKGRSEDVVLMVALEESRSISCRLQPNQFVANTYQR